MNNDFVAGIEILINCKRLVEDIIEEKKMILRRMEERGADPLQLKRLQETIDRYQKVLDGEKYNGYYE